MDELFSKIICNSVGIYDNFFDFAVPFKQKKISEIDFNNDIIYLRVLDNKLYSYIFEKFNYSYARKVNFEYKNDLLALSLANWIYGTNYYKSKFKSLSYSLEYNIENDIYIEPDSLVNVYSYDYIPKEYYKLRKQDIFYNVKIISHIMYKSEIADFIRKFDFVDNKI